MNHPSFRARFFSHLTVMSLGFGVSTIVFFFLNIITARSLGPEMYGKLNFLLSVSQIMLIILLFGIPGILIKKLAQEPLETIREKFLPVSVLLLSVLSFFFIVLAFMLRHFLPEWSFFQEPVFFLFLLLLPILGAGRLLFQNFYHGLHQFPLVAKILTLSSLFALVVFFLVLKIWTDAALAFLTAQLVPSVFFLLVFFLKEPWSALPRSWLVFRSFFKEIFSSYGSGLAIIFLQQIDRLLLQYFLGPKELGIYSASYALSLFILGYAMGLVMQVLFPMVSRLTLSFHVLKTIRKSLFIMGGVFFAFSFLMLLLGEFIYGSSFSIPFAFKLLFALNAVFYLLYQYLSNIFCGIIPNGFSLYFRMNLIGLLVMGVGISLSISLYGLPAVIVMSILTYLWLTAGMAFILFRHPLSS